jgi:hypothetical protein
MATSPQGAREDLLAIGQESLRLLAARGQPVTVERVTRVRRRVEDFLRKAPNDWVVGVAVLMGRRLD